MNGIPAKRPISSGNLPPSRRGCGRPSWNLPSNAPPKLLVPRQLQISTIDVDELPPNRPERSPHRPIPIARAPPNRNNLTPNTSTNRSIPPQKALRCPRRSTPPLADNRLVEPFDNSIPVNPVALEEDFCLREEAYMAFPPEVIDSTTRQAICRFQVNFDNAVKQIEHVCCCCSRFVDLSQLEILPDNNAVIMAAFETNILRRCDLDICGCYAGTLNFCHNCWTHVSRGKEPKFSISNMMPQLCYQHYPVPLEDLTSAEEAVIARAYPVIIILKLRPNNSFNPGSYRGVRGHFVLLPQNPGLLLNLLPSKTTFVDNVVRVVWVGKTLPQPERLSGFVSIRKHCVILALHWLMANNPLYENIEINHRLLETWKDEFILSGIMDSMVHCNSDKHEREGYATDFCNGNFENNLDAAIASTGIKGDHINSGCIYSDINDERQNLTLRLLSAVGNIKAKASTSDPLTSTIVSYRNRGQLVPLNDWEDLYFFIAAFSCLFPFGSGGYLEQRKGPLSLEAWA